MRRIIALILICLCLATIVFAGVTNSFDVHKESDKPAHWTYRAIRDAIHIEMEPAFEVIDRLEERIKKLEEKDEEDEDYCFCGSSSVDGVYHMPPCTGKRSD